MIKIYGVKQSCSKNLNRSRARGPVLKIFAKYFVSGIFLGLLLVLNAYLIFERTTISGEPFLGRGRKATLPAATPISFHTWIIIELFLVLLLVIILLVKSLRSQETLRYLEI
ncbi:MAG: hypothetical protein ACTSX9_05005 [Candidatus Njordarchaeales archaeon]